MKQYFYCSFSLFLCFLLNLQSVVFSQSFGNRLHLVLGFGAQAQDRRYFDMSPGYVRDLESVSSKALTISYSLRVSKSILSGRRFSINIGVGFQSEVNRVLRPYDKVQFVDPFTTPFVTSESVALEAYVVQSGMGTFSWLYKLYAMKNGQMLFVSIDAFGSAHFLKSARKYAGNSNGKSLWFHTWKVAPYSLEINPGLGYDKGKYRVTLSYRAWQIKQVDPVLFSPRLYHNLPEGEYERYNPFKLWVTVSRDL